MIRLVIVDDLAREELRAAMNWYEDRRAGLGADLLSEAEAVFASLGSPTTIGVNVPHTRVPARVKRILLSRFPYAVVYIEVDNLVRVIAVAHFRRRPGYWKPRLRG